MAFNNDGTVTIRYGPQELCGDAANWLPTPGDDWYLGMPIYRSGESVFDGRYEVPEPAPIV